jgi:hypothetical protein
MPRDDVDHAAVATDRERHFRDREPASDLVKPTDRRFVHPRVAAMDHPVEVRALPQHGPVEPRAECGCESPDVAEPDAVEATGLDLHDDRAWDPGQAGRVALAKGPTDPKRTQRGTDPLVVHARRMARGDHHGLMPSINV